MTVADLLGGIGDLAGERGEQTAHQVFDRLRHELEDVAEVCAGHAGWQPDMPLRLAKATVSWLVVCPRRAVTPDSPTPGPDLALGALIDAVAKVATVKRLDHGDGAAAVEAGLGWLRADGGQDDLVAWLDDLDDEAAAELRATAAERSAQLLSGWPAVDPGSWPRVDEWLRLHLAGGAVSIAGRIDVAFGGPPTTRPTVLVEVKGGAWRDGHRADAHLYGLLAGLRDGRAPAAVVTVCAADGKVNVEPIRAGVAEAASLRVARAIEVAADLAAGEVAATAPGPYCVTCPALAACDDGQRHLADRGEATA
jgi:hypothetical protein